MGEKKPNSSFCQVSNNGRLKGHLAKIVWWNDQEGFDVMVSQIGMPVTTMAFFHFIITTKELVGLLGYVNAPENTQKVAQISLEMANHFGATSDHLL